MSYDELALRLNKKMSELENTLFNYQSFTNEWNLKLNSNISCSIKNMDISNMVFPLINLKAFAISEEGINFHLSHFLIHWCFMQSFIQKKMGNKKCPVIILSISAMYKMCIDNASVKIQKLISAVF
ncbi:hypothetical protein CEQ21_03035 [Niallia circulans]|uniref:Uncharacterized protein n=1 Tax=Niallia circulans TaxID=1397 RepID=A0A553SSF6_NIACI|nr:hypothetical protein CEQ21_03035 [Niallia circulans]